MHDGLTVLGSVLSGGVLPSIAVSDNGNYSLDVTSLAITMRTSITNEGGFGLVPYPNSLYWVADPGRHCGFRCDESSFLGRDIWQPVLCNVSRRSRD